MIRKNLKTQDNPDYRPFSGKQVSFHVKNWHKSLTLSF
jgi:hypothetical protein